MGKLSRPIHSQPEVAERVCEIYQSGHFEEGVKLVWHVETDHTVLFHVELASGRMREVVAPIELTRATQEL